jgi:DNA repair exonuclease SbcCD ATPase subunit
MIRNIKNLIINKFYEPVRATEPIRLSLFKKFLRIKLKIKKNLNHDNFQMSSNHHSNNDFKKHPEISIKKNFNDLELGGIQKIEKKLDTNHIEKKNKFLKKKLTRKLTRIKRKIKRYKVSQLNNDDINHDNYNKMTNNNNNDRLNELSSKIKSLQSELSNLQTNSSSEQNSSEAIKIKNKYKKKIKKLRNKINKLNKHNDLKDNVININDEVIIKSKPIQDLENVSSDKARIEELEKQIQSYKKENQELIEKVSNKTNIQNSNENYQNQIQSLEDKIRHYQEENIRLANKISSQEKRIEIMNNQIQNFDNLKNKLYEQVNILGDTLLDNDNVEKIYDERDLDNNTVNPENQKIIKMVNSDNLIVSNIDPINNTISDTKKTDLTDNVLDQEISKIFS